MFQAESINLLFCRTTYTKIVDVRASVLLNLDIRRAASPAPPFAIHSGLNALFAAMSLAASYSTFRTILPSKCDWCADFGSRNVLTGCPLPCSLSFSKTLILFCGELLHTHTRQHEIQISPILCKQYPLRMAYDEESYPEDHRTGTE